MTQDQFAGYLDGTLTGVEMQAVATHLEVCRDCAQAFAQVRGLQGVLSALGPAKMPDDLGLRLRVAISREAARRQGWRDAVSMRWENVVRPAVVRYGAGLACAVALIGSMTMLVGMVATPQAVLANDEPLGALTTPHFLYSAEPAQPLALGDDATVLIDAKVDAQGKVYDFTIVSGPQDARVQAQVRERLMLAQYAPARAFDQPINGRVLVVFTGTRVRG